MKTLKIEHFYKNYPFYKIVYGREYEQKAIEVAKFSSALDIWKANVIKKNFPIHILEAFAGKSEHKQFWKNYKQHDIKSYLSMDIEKNDDPNVIQGDIKTCKLPDNINAVFAYYYSMHFVTDEYGMHTREAMVRMFNNVYKGLKANKKKHKLPSFFAVHLDITDTKDYIMSKMVEPSVTDFAFPVPINSPLWEYYNANPYKDRLVYVTDLKREYDWLTQTTIETYSKGRMFLNDKLIQRIIIEKPFTYRPWTADNIIEIGISAGFKVMMFNSDTENFYSDIYLLSDKFSADGDDDDYANKNPTEVLFYL